MLTIKPKPPSSLQAKPAAAKSSRSAKTKVAKNKATPRDEAAEVCAVLSPQEKLLQTAFKNQKHAEILRLLNSGVKAKEQTLHWLLTAPISYATKLNREAIANLEPFNFLYHLIHNPGINPEIFKTMLGKAVSTVCPLDDNMVVLADAKGECSKQKRQRFEQKLEASLPVFLLAPGLVNYQVSRGDDHFEKAKLRPVVNPAWGKHLTEELRAKLLDAYTSMFSWLTNQAPALTETKTETDSANMQLVSIARFIKGRSPTHKSYIHAIRTEGNLPYATKSEGLEANMFR